MMLSLKFLSLALLGTLTVIGGVGCKRSAKKHEPNLGLAAEMLCRASKLGLDPPKSAYQEFAKRGDPFQGKKVVKANLKYYVGKMAFIQYVERRSRELPPEVKKGFEKLWDGAAGNEPLELYKVVKSSFAEHGVTLDCPEFQRFQAVTDKEFRRLMSLPGY